MNNKQRKPFKGRQQRDGFGNKPDGNKNWKDRKQSGAHTWNRDDKRLNDSGNKPFRGGSDRDKNWDSRKQSGGNRWNRDDRRRDGPPQGGFDRKNKSYPPWKSRPQRDDRGGNSLDSNNRKNSPGDSFERRDRPRQNREWTGRQFKDNRRKGWAAPESRPPREHATEHRHDAAELRPVIVGRKPVLEAIRAGTQIDRVLLLHGTQGGIIEGIEAQARQKHIRVQEVDKEQFAQIAGDEHAQGVAAIIAKRKQASVEDILERGKQRGEQALVLILDEIEDPHNLGALIRTAECSGFHGVIIPRHHAAPITSTVVKSSAGATEHLPIAEVTNLVPVIDELKKNGFWVIGLDMEGDKLYTQVDFSNPTALVVGSEGKGIRRLVKEHCDVLVKIPLHGMIDSLNASVAGALVMFEARKQKLPG